MTAAQYLRPRLRLRRQSFALILGTALAVQCTPLLVTRVLPFHDAAGIIGLTGVFAHVGDPQARIADFYDIDFGPYPSVLYFGWGYLAARLHLPVDIAFNLFVALFCLAGPPLALLPLLRSFGRPRVLALLALPVGYHHQIWYGFLGSAAAVPGIILALAFAKRVVDEPRARHHLALAGALFYVALAHPFSFALALAVIAPLCAWPPAPGPCAARVRTFALRFTVFIPAFLFLAAWAATFFERPGGGDAPWSLHLARELRLQRPPLGEDLMTFVEWLGNGYQSRADEIVPAVALVCVAAFLVLGVRTEQDARPGPTGRRDWIWLAWAAVVLALGYLLLPNKVHWPTFWWGVRVRCALPLFVIAVAAIRPARRGLPLLAVAPALLAAMVFAGVITYDFATHWRGRVLAGFDEALAVIPPGQSVLGLPAIEETHYARAHPYLVQHYVVRKGGRATPHLRGHPGSYWVTMKPPPVTPPWGNPRHFVWEEHGLGYDYFLLERPLGAPEIDPLGQAPDGAAALLLDHGQWRLYRRAGAPIAPP